MSEISQALAVKAMDGLSMRQSAIAQNIANSNSETFAIRSVNFEEALREAAKDGPEAVRSMMIEMDQNTAQVPGGEIRLDLEMQSATSTAARYSALADLIGRQMQISRAAVRGGR